jgi:plastocyanin
MKRTFAVATAALVLALAGCGDDDEESSAPADTNTGTGATPAPATAEGNGGGKPTTLKISADAGGDLAFDKTSLEAKAGEVTITMDNPSNLPHGVGIEGNGVDAAGQVVDKGGVSEATATLKAGTYEYYCPVPGHTEGGMKGELTVE